MALNHNYILYKLKPELYEHRIESILYTILGNHDLNWESIPMIEEEFNIKYEDDALEFNCRISGDTAINIDYVKNNLDKPWNWFWLSQNESISFIDIIDNPQLPWEYDFLHYRDFTSDDIKYIKTKSDYNKQALHTIYSNPKLTFDMIGDILDDVEKEQFLIQNPNTTLQLLRDTVGELTENIISEVSFYIKISPEEFIENIDLPWNYVSLAENSNITMAHFEAHIQYLLKTHSVEETSDIIQSNWDLYLLFRSMKIDISFIKKYKNILGDLIKYASINSGITLDDIDKNPDISWNFHNMDKRDDLTLEFIKKHHDKTYLMDASTVNKNITFDMIKNTPELNWKKHLFMNNPNATYKDILEIYKDGMTIYTSYGRYNAVVIIQRYWKKYIKRRHRKKM